MTPEILNLLFVNECVKKNFNFFLKTKNFEVLSNVLVISFSLFNLWPFSHFGFVIINECVYLITDKTFSLNVSLFWGK